MTGKIISRYPILENLEEGAIALAACERLTRTHFLRCR